MRNFRLCQRCGRTYEVQSRFSPMCKSCVEDIEKKIELILKNGIAYEKVH